MLTYRGHGEVVEATGDVLFGTNVVVVLFGVARTNAVVGATGDVVFGTNVVAGATDNVVVVLFGVARTNVVVNEVVKHVGHVVFVATKNAARSDGHLK